MSEISEPLDIGSERYRVYTYDDGRSFRIDNPALLYVLYETSGASHRVVTEDGMTHRPERGWVGISWLPKNGQPAFVA